MRAGAQFRHVGLSDGEEIRFGKCRLQFVEPPGHTIESICVLVTDHDRAPEPLAVLAGDTLFIVDVGRSDLSPGYTPQHLAELLYDSLHRKFLSLPDDVRVYPARTPVPCAESKSVSRFCRGRITPSFPA